MNLENLKYWIDKDGNKVYGNPKKYNKPLEYLMSNNPEDIISKKGIRIRKIIHPVFVKLLPLTSKNKLKIVKDSEYSGKIPKDKKIIFVANHGFKDDVALTLMSAKYHAYPVFASIPDFFYTIDGYALWANGVILMDRKDKESKNAVLPKINYAFSQGLKRVIIFPEGVWNKNPNEMVLDLWKGAVLAAKANDALVVPISNLNKDMKIDNDVSKGKKGICYSSIGKPIDVSNMTVEEAVTNVRDALATGKYNLTENYSTAFRDNLGYNGEEYWDSYVSELISTAHMVKDCTIINEDGTIKKVDSRAYDYEIENSADFRRKDKISEFDVFETTNRLPLNKNNMKILVKTLPVKNKNKNYFEE